MCRWLAYSGAPILLETALYSPANSMIDQSLHSKLGAEATNGDGFGVGWYDDYEVPGVFRSIEPAWNDENLRELSRHITSRLFFAHLRAAIGSPVQQTNCHPFRHGRWRSCTTGTWTSFPGSAATSCSPSTSRCTPR
jgi:predicted glutamine amidotransferase